MTLRRMTPAAKTQMLTKANLERLVFRWNGVRAFSGRGYYWMSNSPNTNVAYRNLPLYLFDLCSIMNYSEGVLDSPNPMVALRQVSATGTMAFEPVDCSVDSGGAGVTTKLTREVYTLTGAGGGINLPAPYTKSMLESVGIKLNCWGAIAKATKYIISIVQFRDKDLVPVHTALADDVAQAVINVDNGDKRSDFYQSLIKPLTYNPIATTGGAFAKRMKVIKTMTFNIAPHDTSDSDADPSVKSVSLNLTMNKLLNFVQSATKLSTAANTVDDSDYAVQGGGQITSQTYPTSRVYLMIRASNYGVDSGGDANTVTPSFDLSIKLHHKVAA